MDSPEARSSGARHLQVMPAPTVPPAVRLPRKIRPATARSTGFVPQATRIIVAPSTSRLPLPARRRNPLPWRALAFSLTVVSFGAVGTYSLTTMGTEHWFSAEVSDPPRQLHLAPSGTTGRDAAPAQTPPVIEPLITTPAAATTPLTTTPLTTTPLTTDTPTPTRTTTGRSGVTSSTPVAIPGAARTIKVPTSPKRPPSTPTVPPATGGAPPPEATCTYGYAIDAQWDGGLVATITLTNTTGQPLTDWDGGFGLLSVATITKSWGAGMRQVGDWVVLTPPPDYNTTIGPGATITIGFQASTVASVRELGGFSLVGRRCALRTSG
jgi:hypothetical protein